jgi:hypothetical protein
VTSLVTFLLLNFVLFSRGTNSADLEPVTNADLLGFAAY